ncbi:MAG: CarD family transcriptional regulator [Desulfatirhabdiaceae bacterium]
MTGKKPTDRSTHHMTASLPVCCSFTIGDLAVYPGHGVGQIVAIERKTVNGEPHEFFMMRILENDLLIMIPVKKVQMVGLRTIIDQADIPKIYDIFKMSRDMTADTQTWNRRYREYMDKIKTGSIYDVAIVFRDLYILRLTKDLSFGERKLYDTAQTLLVRELSTSRQTSEACILSEIETLFSQDTSCR